MSQKLTCVQAYKARLHFLDFIYFTTYDDNLGSILGGMALYSDISGQQPETMDPAAFDDWMDSIKIIINNKIITYSFDELTTEQAYASIHQYFVTYCDLGAEQSIFALRDLLGFDIEQSNVTKFLWSRWLQSVDFVKHKEMFQIRNCNFIGEKTLLSKESSFKIMQFFLDNYCQQDYNQYLIDLVKNSRIKQFDEESITKSHIWNIWQQGLAQAMDKENCKELNLLVSFYSMAFFLLDYFDEEQVTILEDMILKFSIDKDSKPINFSFWRNWSSAAVKLNAKQMELINNLISINTPVSHEVAYKIIQAWLQYNKDLVGTNVIQQVLADTQGIQQAINEIKHQQRSYLLLDNEVTILETYHIMLKLLELHGKIIPEFAIDIEQGNKPKDFIILLQWIQVSEQIVKIKN